MQAFSLYKSGSDAEVTADTLIGLLPYLFVKANIKDLQAHLSFCYAFFMSSNIGAKSENTKTSFGAAICRVKDFPEQEILSVPSKNYKPEDDFVMKTTEYSER